MRTERNIKFIRPVIKTEMHGDTEMQTNHGAYKTISRVLHLARWSRRYQRNVCVFVEYHHYQVSKCGHLATNWYRIANYICYVNEIRTAYSLLYSYFL